MPYTTKEGRALPLDVPFSIGDTHYPASWLRLAKPEDRDALGITWKKVEEPPVVRPKLSAEVERAIAQAKDTAGKLLAQSDWYVIRETETGTAIPEDWAEYRTAVRAYCDELEQKLSEATDHESFDQVKQHEWPEDPNQKKFRLAIEAEEAAAKEGRQDG